MTGPRTYRRDSIRVFLSASEKREIQAAATAAGESMSEYAVEAALARLRGTIHVRPPVSSHIEELARLRGVDVDTLIMDAMLHYARQAKG